MKLTRSSAGARSRTTTHSSDASSRRSCAYRHWARSMPQRRVVGTLVEIVELVLPPSAPLLPRLEVARPPLDPGRVQRDARGADRHAGGVVRIARRRLERACLRRCRPPSRAARERRRRTRLEQDRVAGRRRQRLDPLDRLGHGRRPEDVCGPDQPDEVVGPAEPSRRSECPSPRSHATAPPPPPGSASTPRPRCPTSR